MEGFRSVIRVDCHPLPVKNKEKEIRESGWCTIAREVCGKKEREKQAKVSIRIGKEENDNEWETEKKEAKQQKPRAVKDNPHPTPTQLLSTPYLPQPPTAYIDPLHVSPDRKTDTRTEEP